MTPTNVVTGGRNWNLNAAQQSKVLAVLATVGCDGFPVSENELVECKAVGVLMQAGYEVKSPLQLDEERSIAGKLPMPSAQEATQEVPDHENVGKLKAIITGLQYDIRDLDLEIADLKADLKAAHKPTATQKTAPEPILPKIWVCPRCQTINPIAQDKCGAEGCTKIRIGSPSSPSVPADYDKGHPLNPGGR